MKFVENPTLGCHLAAIFLKTHSVCLLVFCYQKFKHLIKYFSHYEKKKQQSERELFCKVNEAKVKHVARQR